MRQEVEVTALNSNHTSAGRAHKYNRRMGLNSFVKRKNLGKVPSTCKWVSIHSHLVQPSKGSKTGKTTGSPCSLPSSRLYPSLSCQPDHAFQAIPTSSLIHGFISHESVNIAVNPCRHTTRLVLGPLPPCAVCSSVQYPLAA